MTRVSGQKLFLAAEYGESLCGLMEKREARGRHVRHLRRK